MSRLQNNQGSNKGNPGDVAVIWDVIFLYSRLVQNQALIMDQTSTINGNIKDAKCVSVKDLKKAQRYHNNIFVYGRKFFLTPPFWNA